MNANSVFCIYSVGADCIVPLSPPVDGGVVPPLSPPVEGGVVVPLSPGLSVPVSCAGGV